MVELVVMVQRVLVLPMVLLVQLQEEAVVVLTELTAMLVLTVK